MDVGQHPVARQGVAGELHAERRAAPRCAPRRSRSASRRGRSPRARRRAAARVDRRVPSPAKPVSSTAALDLDAAGCAAAPPAGARSRSAASSARRGSGVSTRVEADMRDPPGAGGDVDAPCTLLPAAANGCAAAHAVDQLERAAPHHQRLRLVGALRPPCRRCGPARRSVRARPPWSVPPARHPPRARLPASACLHPPGTPPGWPPRPVSCSRMTVGTAVYGRMGASRWTSQPGSMASGCSATRRPSPSTISTWTLLPRLTGQDLAGIGVASVGHRRRLLAAIAALGRPARCRLRREQRARAAAAHGDVRRSRRLDAAVAAARPGGAARGDPRLPERGRRRDRPLRRPSSPSSWATACWPISAGRGRTRTMPSGRCGPGWPSSARWRGIGSPAGEPLAVRDRHRHRLGRGRRADRRRRGAGAGRWSARRPTSRRGCRRWPSRASVVIAEATRRLLGRHFRPVEPSGPADAARVRRRRWRPGACVGDGTGRGPLRGAAWRHAARRWSAASASWPCCWSSGERRKAGRARPSLLLRRGRHRQVAAGPALLDAAARRAASAGPLPVLAAPHRQRALPGHRGTELRPARAARQLGAGWISSTACSRGRATPVGLPALASSRQRSGWER